MISIIHAAAEDKPRTKKSVVRKSPRSCQYTELTAKDSVSKANAPEDWVLITLTWDLRPTKKQKAELAGGKKIQRPSLPLLQVFFTPS